MVPTPAQPPVAACSFCMKPNTDVVRLVAGPGVFICDGCVVLCQQVIEASTGSPGFPLAHWEQVADLDAVLAHLPLVARAGAQVEDTLVRWVRRGRELGATWARIGEALGMTRQSAWERFSGEE
jgi:hypothetical protein